MLSLRTASLAPAMTSTSTLAALSTSSPRLVTSIKTTTTLSCSTRRNITSTCSPSSFLLSNQLNTKYRAVSPLQQAHRYPSTFTYRTYATMMKALIYKGVNEVSLAEKPKPSLVYPADAIIKLTKTTICGTDLHIRKGDVATCVPGTTLGHEGVGIVEEAGSAVNGFKKGDRVLISCICSCATCEYCRKGMYSHCETGGWILGNTVDGTQAEYVRIPHADSSLYAIPEGVDERALVMLSDIFPTGYECGVLNGNVEPGSTVAIVGAGPIGLAALITAQMYSPAMVIMLDMDANRLEVSKTFGAKHTVDPSKGDPVDEVKKMTGGKGCDTVIEAVGVPQSFELCQKLLAPGGTLANVGVHGVKADLHLEDLWAHNISITTRLVDTVTTPMLLKLVQSGKLDPTKLITHTYKFNEMEKAYDTFGKAADHNALKMIIEM